MEVVKVSGLKKVNWKKTTLIGCCSYLLAVGVNYFAFKNSLKSTIMVSIGYFFIPFIANAFSFFRYRKLAHFHVSWNDSTLFFNCGRGEKQISLVDILAVEVKLDDIIIVAKDGKLVLFIEAFEEMEDRKKIKSFFNQFPETGK